MSGRASRDQKRGTEVAKGFLTHFYVMREAGDSHLTEHKSHYLNPSPASSPQRQASQMQFLDLPGELRLRIYSELLVQHGPVEFVADYDHRGPSLVRVGKTDLNPSLLRVSRMVNEETAALLYSNNCFRFPDAYRSFNDSEAPFVEPFLQRIGRNAGLLRHLYVNFPSSFAPVAGGGHCLRDEYSQIFRIFKETCTSLRTIEILSEPPNSMLSLYDVSRAAKMLRALDAGGLNAISSLEKILLIYGEYDMDDEFISLRESLMQRTPSKKWSIELSQVHEKQWISCDGRVKFKKIEDCNLYNEQEASRASIQAEEREAQLQREDEHWLERNKSYWKNVSIGFNTNYTNPFGDLCVQNSKN